MSQVKEEFQFYRLSTTGKDIDFSWSFCCLALVFSQHASPPFFSATTKVLPCFLVGRKEQNQNLFSLGRCKKLSVSSFSRKLKKRPNNRNWDTWKTPRPNFQYWFIEARRIDGWEHSGAFWLSWSFIISGLIPSFFMPFHWNREPRALGSRQVGDFITLCWKDVFVWRDNH